MTVHLWRAKVAHGIVIDCNCCSLQAKETSAHRFFECLRAREIWDFAQSILIHLQRNITGAQEILTLYTVFSELPSPDVS